MILLCPRLTSCCDQGGLCVPPVCPDLGATISSAFISTHAYTQPLFGPCTNPSDLKWLAAQTHLSLDVSMRLYTAIRFSMNQSIRSLRRRLRQATQCHAVSRILAPLLLDYFWLFGTNDLLEESISLHRELVASPHVVDDQESAADLLDGLGEALCGRYMQFGALDDIDEAIHLHEQSRCLRGSTRALVLHSWLHNVGVAFYKRSMRSSNSRDDLYVAIQMLKQALDHCCSFDDAAGTLCYLALALGEARQYEEALVCSQQAFLSAPPGHRYHPLAGIVVVATLCRCGGLRAAWSCSATPVQYYIFKLAIGINHPYACLASVVLGNIIYNQPGHDRIRELVHDARALDCRFSADHIYSYFLAIQTGVALSAAYSATGSLVYLDDTIAYERYQLREYYSSRRVMPFLWVNLAHFLHVRHELTGSPEDVDEAISLLEAVGEDIPVAQTAEGNLHYKGILGDLFLARFLLSGTSSDLQAGLDMHRQYLEIHDITHDTPSRLTHLIGAVKAVEIGYRHTRDDTILKTILALLRVTLPAVDPEYDDYPEGIDALAVVLRLLGEHTGEAAYLREALPMHLHALSLLPEGSILRPIFLGHLAICRVALWQLTGAYEELHDAMNEFALVVGDHTSSPPRRFRHALEWSRAAKHAGGELRLLALRQAITIRSKAVAFSGTMHARLYALRMAPGLCAEAALHALACGDSITAVNLLEQGRSVFWGQALNSRRAPARCGGALSCRFVEVSKALAVSPADYPLAQRKVLFDELESLEEHAYSAEPSSKLQGQPNSYRPYCLGHTVILAATASTAVAFVLPSGSTAIIPVPLAGVHLDVLQRMVNVLHAENGQSKRTGLRPKTPESVSRLGIIVSQRKHRPSYDNVLFELWTLIARPIIEALGIKAGDLLDRPRIFWCPTGPFSFLPLHAAGIYTGPSKVSVSDYVISSYIPTLSAVLEAYDDRPLTPITSDNARTLLVAVPDAPGHGLLPKTVEEVDIVRGLLPRSSVLVGDVTVDRVLAELPPATFLHLACHGKHDAKDVLNSGFVFQDGTLKLSSLMDLQINDGCFAFLSTCESAMGDESLADETMHLAAAMLFIGYRSVVGTLWTMHDTDGPKVAEHVYRELLKDRERFDYDAVPRALDAAVRELRENGVHPSRWATWIHVGI